MTFKIADPKQGGAGATMAMAMSGTVAGAQALPIGMRRRLLAWMTDMAYIMAGCMVFVIGMNGLLIPQHLIAGGLGGIRRHAG